MFRGIIVCYPFVRTFQYCVVTLRVFVESCLRRHPKWVRDRLSPNTEGTPHSPGKSTYARAEVTSPPRTNRSVGKSSISSSGTLHRDLNSDSDSDLDMDSNGRGTRYAQKSSWTREVLLSPTTGVIAIQVLFSLLVTYLYSLSKPLLFSLIQT